MVNSTQKVHSPQLQEMKAMLKMQQEELEIRQNRKMFFSGKLSKLMNRQRIYELEKSIQARKKYVKHVENQLEGFNAKINEVEQIQQGHETA